MHGMMKALVKREAYGVKMEQVPIPKCEKDGILVKILFTAICGSDVSRFKWDPSMGTPSFRIPIVVGHELCGEIIEVGEQVSHLKVGQIVTADTHIPCGHCYQCQNGQQHICSNLKVFGLNVDGCFSDYYAFPAICARPAPEGLPLEQAALLEPMGVAYHALSMNTVAGETVAIIGCGAIGLMAVQIAKTLGAAKVIGVSRSKINLDRALEFGADAVVSAKEFDYPSEEIKRLTDGYGAGVVVESSGNVSAFLDALQAVRKGGNFIAASMPAKEVPINFPRDVVRKELTIRGFHGRRMFETWTAVEGLINQKKLDLSKYITAVIPMEDYEKGFAMAQQSEHIKIVMKP